jgi:wyosine [tRNA(Phe)-imidazoG37] synthetase (radical SAM superfamily)
MKTPSSASKYVFGPVPSRRLGRSLGVDLVPYKTCTFDCIYSDLGRTTHKTVSRQSHVSREEVERELKLSLSILEKKPDYITLSGSGEPTLNQNIGEIIHTIKDLTSIPVAVLTNGSLLSIEEVRNELLTADLVLPSLDAVTPFIFEVINRPHPLLNIEAIIPGLIQFRKEFQDQIWLEIVFCRGVNDDKEEIVKLKEAIERIQPDRVQLNTAARPPAEDFAYPLTLKRLEKVRNLFGNNAEVVSEFAAPMGDSLESDKDAEILNLIKRRPCTAEDISRALGLHLDEVVKDLSRLARKGVIRYRMYEHHCFYESAPTH